MTNTLVRIVEDEDRMASSLATLLDSIGFDYQIYNSAENFLSAEDPSVPGCLVTDVLMPGMTGMEMLREMSARDWDLPFIVLTAHADVPMAVEAMSLGAIGLLEKPYRAHEVIQLIKRAAGQDLKFRAVAVKRVELRLLFEKLTPRETEVLELLMQGLANKNIGTRLGISQRTVELHRARVMEKLEVDSVAALVELGLLYQSLLKQ